MTVMEDPERPPPYFGDYPHGAYWSALVPQGEEGPEEEDYTPLPEGSELRVMWDETAGPLWSDEGMLPNEPEWFRRALGLSEPLIADLRLWLNDMTTFQFGPVAQDRRVRQEQLDQRGRELAHRLKAEVGSRYRVRYD